MKARFAKLITVGLTPIYFAIGLLNFLPALANNSAPVIPRVNVTADKVVLVALHGFGLSKQSYIPLTKKLEEHGFIFEAIDVRGFGEKASYLLDFEKAAFDVASHLAEVRKKYPNHKLLIMGESMGGALALKVAADNSGIVDGVIASEPAYKLSVNLLLYPEVILNLLVRPNAPNKVPLGFAKRVTTMEPFLSDLKDKLSNQRGYTARELWKFRSLMKSIPTAVTQLCQTPVLFLQGDSDRLVKPSGTSALSRISASAPHKLVVLRHRGHLLLEENQANDEVLAALDGWLTELDASNQQIAITATSLQSQLVSRNQIPQPEDK
jgi:alpha-beta hydrolase superfamily lysophospholipase